MRRGKEDKRERQEVFQNMKSRLREVEWPVIQLVLVLVL
jgi:hypothetical protein